MLIWSGQEFPARSYSLPRRIGRFSERIHRKTLWLVWYLNHERISCTVDCSLKQANSRGEGQGWGLVTVDAGSQGIAGGREDSRGRGEPKCSPYAPS